MLLRETDFLSVLRVVIRAHSRIIPLFNKNGSARPAVPNRQTRSP
jgi:hypothetical protein